MNLFIDDLAKYLIDEWDRSLGVRDGAKEDRFIVQSQDLERIGVLALLHATIQELTLLASGNQAENRENKHRPNVRGVPDLLETLLASN